ncbi:MAG: penicillin acylase family protein [Pseudohongiellaceae bacterium]
MQRYRFFSGGVVLALAVSGCTEPAERPATDVPEGVAEEAWEYDTRIRWTGYGIPHVDADDWGSLGYGFAWATANDAICTMARDVVMVNGELTRYFGDSPEHRASDAFHRAILDEDMLAYYRAEQSQRSRDFAAGYVAGYNRYVSDHGSNLPAACAEQSWVRTLDENDVERLNIGVGIRYGLGRFIREVASAAPPGEPVARLDTDFSAPAAYGSNAVGMGADVTASGSGLLLGNPHYPWQGSSRFHMIHTTIPGEVDVMGVSLYTTSRVAIGFNHDVAWSHTVSTGLRSTFYALTLNPDDPMQYRYGDGYRDIEAVEVNIPVAGDAEPVEHTVYMTHYGPVVRSEQLPWTGETAFAIRDANLYNTRQAETYDAINKATSVAGLEEALALQGVSWVNTVAADRHGDALYADLSAVPNVDAALLERCNAAPAGLPDQVVVLNGSDPDCEWREDDRSAIPGVMPPQQMPSLTRSDYVHNANGSYWLSNPEAPLEGFSPIIGSERSAVSLRTRAGLSFIREALDSGAAIRQEDLQAMLFSHRNFGAELLLDDLLALCESLDGPVDAGEAETVDVAPACQVLTQWDRRMAPDSRGGHVWREFMRTARGIEGLYRVPFDADDPVRTPRGLNTEDAELRSRLLASLAQAVQRLDEHGIALDARLGDIQYTLDGDERIAVPGGEGWAGMWSVIIAGLQEEAGYTPIAHGNSYIQVVGWDEEGQVDPRAILTYSQSDDPASPHYADQTRLYARGEWLRLPFTEEEIAADPDLETLVLRE